MLTDYFDSLLAAGALFFARYWLSAVIGVVTGFVILAVGKVATRKMAANKNVHHWRCFDGACVLGFAHS